MAARRPFWKWHRWKSIGFCLWPPSTCIWNLKLKFQSKLDLCSGNQTMSSTDRRTDRRTDGQTDKVNPVYPPPTSLGGGITIIHLPYELQEHIDRSVQDCRNYIASALELLQSSTKSLISLALSCKVIIISTCFMPFTCPWSFIFGEGFIHVSTHSLLANVRWDKPLTHWGRDKMVAVCRGHLHTHISSNDFFLIQTSQFFFT